MSRVTRKAFSGSCPRYSILLRKCVVSFMNECVVCTKGLRWWSTIVKYVKKDDCCWKQWAGRGCPSYVFWVKCRNVRV